MQTKTENSLTGFILINKPHNFSSFYCVKYIKKILKQKIKIGHTGTLDNFATGLLIICIGRSATKFVNSLMNLDKEYILKAKLGELTDTLDYTGKIIEQKEIKNTTRADILDAIKQLGKNYIQIPPIYSALKYQGKPLYDLARKNKIEQKELQEIVEKKARMVQLYKIELLDFNLPFFTLKTNVSKGTYVRSLANDIAQKLNLPATTYELQRTKIGALSLDNAIDLTKLKTIEDIQNHLISIEKLSQTLLI